MLSTDHPHPLHAIFFLVLNIHTRTSGEIISFFEL